jgi:hypothetical protein
MNLANLDEVKSMNADQIRKLAIDIAAIRSPFGKIAVFIEYYFRSHYKNCENDILNSDEGINLVHDINKFHIRTIDNSDHKVGLALRLIGDRHLSIGSDIPKTYLIKEKIGLIQKHFGDAKFTAKKLVDTIGMSDAKFIMRAVIAERAFRRLLKKEKHQ